MNKTTIAVVAIILIAGAVYFFTQNTAEAPSSDSSDTRLTDSEQNTPPVTPALEGQGTFADLMAKGGNYECNVSTGNSGSESEGVVYVSGNKMHADFNTTSNGVTMKSYMMIADGFVYMWSDRASQGFKSAVNSGSSTQQGGFDASANINYNCRLWAVDESKFIPPSNITFMGVN